MKPRIGVYLSERMAARLAAAAKRPGTSKSALVEAALAQFFGGDDDTNDLPVDRRLSQMSRQLEELDRGLRIVNETVALQARFHLAVTPVLPAADQRAACVLGSERFDELAAQVRRRVQLGTSLMQETMDRLDTTKRNTAMIALSGGAPQTCSPVQKPALPTSSLVGDKAESFAAVREGGSLFNFPGRVTAQVTEHVYDTPTGRSLLVPQGSRLIGIYDNHITHGQSRVLLVWTRLIMPNGRSIILERQQGADTAGYAGLEDGIDNHWVALFKAALLSTLLGVGSELGAGSDASNNGDIIQALRHGSSDSFNQTGQKVVQRNLNIQPTLTIRPGFPVRVIVNRDLVLEPYKG